METSISRYNNNWRISFDIVFAWSSESASVPSGWKGGRMTLRNNWQLFYEEFCYMTKENVNKKGRFSSRSRCLSLPSVTEGTSRFTFSVVLDRKLDSYLGYPSIQTSRVSSLHHTYRGVQRLDWKHSFKGVLLSSCHWADDTLIFTRIRFINTEWYPYGTDFTMDDGFGCCDILLCRR